MTHIPSCTVLAPLCHSVLRSQLPLDHNLNHNLVTDRTTAGQIAAPELPKGARARAGPGWRDRASRPRRRYRDGDGFPRRAGRAALPTLGNRPGWCRRHSRRRGLPSLKERGESRPGQSPASGATPAFGATPAPFGREAPACTRSILLTTGSQASSAGV